MQDPRNNKFLVEEGSKIGRLSVGPLVFNIREHPLFVQTPISYVKQGRLRECTCICGEVKLVAERILESGRVLSCGCLKRDKAYEANQKRLNTKSTIEERKRLSLEIKSEQARLKYYLVQTPKDPHRIEQIAQKIKELMIKRLGTVNYKRNAKDRIRRREQKLLEEIGIDMSVNHVTEEQPK